MSIGFNSVPAAALTPFVFVEFDNAKAQQGPALLRYRAIAIGQKIAAGSGVAGSLYKVSSEEQVITLAGRGSMLHRQAKAWFAQNRFTELNIGVLADDAGGTAAAGTLIVTGPATASGTVALLAGGERIAVGVTAGDSANSIAAAINAAINANTDLPVTAGVSTATVTVTARHKGLVFNDYNMRLNYNDGEALPAGVGVAITQLTGGATNPSLTALIAAMGDEWFNIWVHPYTDATSLTAIETELASRFGPTRMIDGLAITAKGDTLGNLSTLGDSRNSPHSCIFEAVLSPCPAFERAARAAAQIAMAAEQDPARPFQTLVLAGELPPVLTDVNTQAERNVLLGDGISTTRKVGTSVQIERVVTTYQTNASGVADASYRDATTMLTLMYLRYSFRQRIANGYPRSKLADDGTNFGAGQEIITPKIGKAEALHWFRDMEQLGLVEGFDQFKRDLIVERNLTDRNRLDFLLPPDLINQLMIVGAKIQFRL